MDSINRYVALDPAALKALAKLRGVVTNGNKAIALEGLVAQDEQKGLGTNLLSTTRSNMLSMMQSNMCPTIWAL
jgi:predicted transcriptional regulator with HTH domain